MENNYLLSTLLLFFATLYMTAQPGIDWQKSLGGSLADAANEIVQTTDGGYILVGYSKSDDGDVTTNQGDADYWVVKLDSSGTIDWQKSYGGSDEDIASSIQQTTDGGYIVAGTSKSINGDVTGNHGSKDYWVLKLSAIGNIVWEQSYGGTADDSAASVRQTADGGYIIAGYSKSTDGDVTGNNGVADYWMLKLTSTGTISWQKSYGGTDVEYPESVRETSDGGYIVVGFSRSVDGDVTGNHGYYDYWVLKLDHTGSLVWEKSYGGTTFDYGTSIEQTTDGGYIVAGISKSNDGDVTGNHGLDDFWVLKITDIGAITWQKSYGGSSFDYAYGIKETNDGGYIVAGYTSSNNYDVLGNHGQSDYWILRITSTGAISWQDCLGGSLEDYAFSIDITSDYGYVLTGWGKSSDGNASGNNGDYDYWVVKLEPDSVGVSEISDSNVLSVFPNPASSQINVRVENMLSDTAFAIFDITGKTVLTGTISEENGQIDLGRLAPGMYDIQIQTGDKKANSRFVKK